MHVAIIGAGFSGMLAAYLLEKRGITVTIYEKEEYIGGHCKTLVSKNSFVELGTICSFTNQIKELLIELNIDYSNKFIYKNFVDSNYKPTEHMSQIEVKSLMNEIDLFKSMLEEYSASFNNTDFGVIDKDLLVPFSDFIKQHQLTALGKFITPFISSFGFGNIDSIQTYYVFKICSLDILYSYLQGDKLLFIHNGTSELIEKLSTNISDIRYTLEVNNIEVINSKVKVETPYSSDLYDKVLITTKLPRDVIKDKLYNTLMKKIETNPFISCVYEVENCDVVTTYYKENQGLVGKIQYFQIFKQNNRTTLVAYAYGHVNKDIIDGITDDIKALKIDIVHLTTVKQWYVFPHLKVENLTSNFYKDIADHQKSSNICLIGSLVSIPSLDKLYGSVTRAVDQITSKKQS